jgi:hypothetical protein
MHHQFGSFAVCLEALRSYRRTPYFQIKRHKVKIPHSSGFFGAYNGKIDQKMVSCLTPPPWMVFEFVHLLSLMAWSRPRDVARPSESFPDVSDRRFG